MRRGARDRAVPAVADARRLLRAPRTPSGAYTRCARAQCAAGGSSGSARAAHAEGAASVPVAWAQQMRFSSAATASGV